MSADERAAEEERTLLEAQQHWQVAMTVDQLIARLQTFPRHLKVVIDGYEGGAGGIVGKNILQAHIIPFDWAYSWYYGPHEPVTSHSDFEYHKERGDQLEEVVYIQRFR